jgi:tripartite-type tricarboxylate transporter receptor subunit TctC
VIPALRIFVALWLGFPFAISARADSPADFYAQKTLTIISSGDVYSEYARILAITLPKHIPGRPAVIVKEMDGAGGLVAANYMYNAAPKDGTVIAATRPTVLVAPLMSPDVVKYELAKFSWIGNLTRDTFVAYVWYNAPITTFEQAKTTPVTMGGSAVGSGGIDYAIFARDLLGYKIKIVSGYKTQHDTRFALENGEIQGTMGTSISSLSTTDWLTTGKIRILAQHGSQRSKAFPDVPLFRDFVLNESYKQMLDLLDLRGDLSKPYFAPPGIPADRLTILRQAFDATLKDPEFIENAAHAGLPVEEPLTGEQLEAAVSKIAQTPSSAVRGLADMFKHFSESP